MLRKISVIALVLAIVLPAFAYQVGDTLSISLNKFMLMLQRETSPAMVRAVGKDACIVSIMKDKAVISDFANCNDTVFAATLTPEGFSPQYLYTLAPGATNWENLSSPNGGDITGQLSIYKIYVSQDTLLNRSVVYLATSCGIMRNGTNLISFYSIFGGDSALPIPCYDIAANEYTYDAFFTGKVFMVATQWGVYKITTCGPNPATPADTQRIGSLSGPVYSVAYDPADTSIIYAGTDRGLYVWDGSTWTHISEVPNINVNEIKFMGTDFFVCTGSGLYILTDSGWTSALPNKNVTDVIQHDGTYYATTLGSGVYKSTDLSQWESFNDGLIVYSAFGGLNGYTIDVMPDGRLIYGCEIGAFVRSADDTAWIYMPDGMGTLLGDVAVQQLLESFENPDSNDTLTVLDKILATYDISRDLLYDADGDSHIMIVISPLAVSTNLGQVDQLVSPIYGYFDPTDEDPSSGNGHDMFVINAGEFDDFTSDKIKTVMAYLTAKYVAWSLDPDEDPIILTGLAMLLTYKAGFDVQDGFMEGNQFGGGGNNCKFLNYPLYSYTIAWMNAPVAREHDRERLFLWLEYLRERFGDDFIEDILFSYWNGIDRIEKDLNDLGYEFDDVFLDWTIANWLDDPSIADGRYGYPEIDFHIDPTKVCVIGPTASTEVVNSYAFKVHEYTPSDSINYFVFNGEDSNFRTVNGQRVSGYVIFMIEVDTIAIDTVVDTTGVETTYVATTETVIDTVELDELNRCKYQKDTPAHFIVANLASSAVSYVASMDTVPPVVTNIYTIQNPISTTSADVYITSEENLYTDVGVNHPTLLAIPANDEYEEQDVEFEEFATYGGGHIYHANITLDAKGDVYLRIYAQDLSGNDVVLTEDTVTIHDLLPAGGTYTAFGGKVVLTLPERAVLHATKVLFDIAASSNYTDENLTPIFSIGHQGIVLNRPAVLLIYDESIKNLPENVALYHYNGSDWELVPCRIDRSTGRVEAVVNSLGLFTIMSGEASKLPETFALLGLVKNPVSTDGVVVFEVPVRSRVRIVLYDASGRLVSTLLDKTVVPGQHELQFNTASLRNGVYFLRMEALNFEAKTKFVVLH